MIVSLIQRRLRLMFQTNKVEGGVLTFLIIP
jgi:hypothetical protein